MLLLCGPISIDVTATAAAAHGVAVSKLLFDSDDPCWSFGPYSIEAVVY
jgi:hypothetical protein